MVVLTARDLRIAYGKSDPVVTDFSLNVEQGQIVALTGASGSGKSSLLYAMAGLLRPRRGSVAICDCDVWSLSDALRADMRRDRIGFLFQDYGLDMGRSVLNNILEPVRYQVRGVQKADINRANALVDSLQIGIPVRRRPSQISGGQAQRIALARALIAMPTVLFADEPTSSLDDASAATVLQIVRASIEKGELSAAVIATHDPRVTIASDGVTRVGA